MPSWRGDGAAAAELGDVRTAAGLLRTEQHLAAAGADGSGGDNVDRAVALPGAGRVGKSVGIGSHSGGPHLARETADPVRAKGPSGAMAYRDGKSLDGIAAGSRADVQRGWARARVSRQPGAIAAALCGATEVVPACGGGLLDQCAGWSTILLRQSADRSRVGAGATQRYGAMAGSQCAHFARAPAAHGRRSTDATIHRRFRP